MDGLIWTGAAISMLGMAGIVFCVVSVVGAKRKKLDDDAMRAHLQKVAVWNLGSLFVSALGLMMVVAGVMLG